MSFYNGVAPKGLAVCVRCKALPAVVHTAKTVTIVICRKCPPDYDGRFTPCSGYSEQGLSQQLAVSEWNAEQTP